MEAEELMNLFDTWWFEKEIFKNQPRLSTPSRFEAGPHQQNNESAKTPEFSRVPTTIARTMSDQLFSKSSFFSGYSMSPDSVLSSSKLQTILSGKEITDEDENSVPTPKERVHVKDSPKKKVTTSRRRGKNMTSKSLSELELEELKGFMDLGFVFSKEDKDSSLASIIPGLQRLGNKEDTENESSVVDDGARVSRHYLSEAWEALERKRKEEPLMNWRIPSLSNKIDMKDNLRWWAHTVASSVK